jgi:bifunctional UDP-N-acetylglucosamine pyrophosphorylase/glucosamine-1-phosphate N-acetyltransferase
MPSDVGVLVLAAGKGTRMKSNLTKMLHPIAGIPLVAHGVHTSQALDPERIVIVVGHQSDQVKTALAAEFGDGTLRYAIQAEQLGTAHAVMCAKDELTNGPSELFILAGDVPLLSIDTLNQMRAIKQEQNAAVCTLSFIVDDTKGYGRILRDEHDQIFAIREDRDCSPEEKKVKECNSAIYLVDTAFLLGSLDNIDDQNDQGEFYLTDIVELAAKENRGVVGVIVEDANEILGVNDKVQLTTLETRWMALKIEELMREGATFRLPHTTYISYHSTVGKDSEIGPNCVLLGNTTIGTNCTIGAGSVLEDVTIEDGTTLPPHSGR